MMPLSPKAAAAVEAAEGFAQVFPEHKFQIVKALQSRGHIVGMTGDGVNDAPALKQANTGIAVSGATDAARAAAALVLTAPGLSVIVQAVETARTIFERMNSYAIYRITETIRIMFFVVAAMIVFKFYPITTVMIILLALLNDLPILTIAYDNTWLDPKPVRWDMRRVLTLATVLGLIGVVETFGILVIAKEWFRLDRRPDSILHLSQTGGGRALDPVRRPHTPAFPDQTVSRADSAGSDPRHAGVGGDDRWVRLAGRAHSVEVRRLRLGVLPGVGLHRRLGQAACVSSSRLDRQTSPTVPATHPSAVASAR